MKQPAWEEIRFAYDEGFLDAEKAHSSKVLIGVGAREALWHAAEKRIREAYGSPVMAQSDTARRDLFAAHALQGLIAGHAGLWPGAEFDYSLIAAMAYGLADAMLAARGEN
jgi:hypothetical protein